jgi:Uma2 family endonuclease
MSTGFAFQLAIPRAPHRLVLDPLLSDEEFENLCFANSDVPLERTRDGVIVVNAPAGYGSGSGNAEITFQLTAWWRNHRRGRVADSSAGIFLPDGSALSPDACYITAEQAATLHGDDLDHFLRFVPAFVLELRSKTDSLAELRRKMETWIENGALVGWLVDPYTHAVTIYEPGHSPRTESGETVTGTGPVEGFALDLTEVWRSYEL